MVTTTRQVRVLLAEPDRALEKDKKLRSRVVHAPVMPPLPCFLLINTFPFIVSIRDPIRAMNVKPSTCTVFQARQAFSALFAF